MIETQLFYLCGAAAGTNVITIQLSEPPAPGEVLQFSYNEVSGIAASSCLDGAAGANGLTGDVQPGSIATTADGDLIYNFAEENYNYPEEDAPIGWVMPDNNSALLMENAWDKFASQVSVQAAHGAYNPTLYVNGDLNDRNWNSVAAAFKPSAGAGTQPTGIHVTRIMHYYNPPLPLTPAWIPFPSTGNAIVIIERLSVERLRGRHDRRGRIIGAIPGRERRSPLPMTTRRSTTPVSVPRRAAAIYPSTGYPTPEPHT